MFHLRISAAIDKNVFIVYNIKAVQRKPICFRFFAGAPRMRLRLTAVT